MKSTRIATLIASVTTSILPSLGAEEPQTLIQRGKLIFTDDFNRAGVEDGIGNDWFLNNKNGAQQAKLTDGRVVIEMAPGAGHSVSVRHDAPFDDGVVKVKFRIFDRLGLKLNFNDPKAKKRTWAGHIARVVAQPKKITISDDLTGAYDLGIRAKRKDKNLPADEKAELEKFVKS